MTTFNFRKYEKSNLPLVGFDAVRYCLYGAGAPDCQIYGSLCRKGYGQPLPGSLYGRSVEQDDARPCLVFVFGGGFIAGERDAERYLPFFHYMVNQGYDVVSIDYRLGLKQVVASGDLSPENMMLGMARTISMAVEDLYDATAFIVDKADEWGIDSSQIVACGSSAGAITVLHGEYALCNASPLVQHLPAGFRYAGIVSFAGAIFEMGEELVWASQPAPMMLFTAMRMRTYRIM